MSVGLPGSGIGGIFYLLSALWMPFDGALRIMRRRGASQARVVATQTCMALGVIGALYLTGIGLEHVLVAFATHSASVHGGSAIAPQVTPRIFKEATFAMTFGTLAVVLLSVQVLRVFFARGATAVTPDAGKRKAA